MSTFEFPQIAKLRQQREEIERALIALEKAQEDASNVIEMVSSTKEKLTALGLPSESLEEWQQAIASLVGSSVTPVDKAINDEWCKKCVTDSQGKESVHDASVVQVVESCKEPIEIIADINQRVRDGLQAWKQGWAVLDPIINKSIRVLNDMMLQDNKFAKQFPEHVAMFLISNPSADFSWLPERATNQIQERVSAKKAEKEAELLGTAVLDIRKDATWETVREVSQQNPQALVQAVLIAKTSAKGKNTSKTQFAESFSDMLYDYIIKTGNESDLEWVPFSEQVKARLSIPHVESTFIEVQEEPVKKSLLEERSLEQQRFDALFEKFRLIESDFPAFSLLSKISAQLQTIFCSPSQPPTVSSLVPHAKTSLLPESVAASLAIAAACFFKDSEFSKLNNQKLLFLKMSKGCLAQTIGLHSLKYSKRLPNWGMWGVGSCATETNTFPKIDPEFSVWVVGADVRPVGVSPQKPTLAQCMDSTEVFPVRKHRDNGLVVTEQAPALTTMHTLDASLDAKRTRNGKESGFAVLYKAPKETRVYEDDAPCLRSLSNTNGNHQGGSGAYKVREFQGEEYYERPITALEAERLMGWEENSTQFAILADGKEVEVSKTQRIRVLGKGMVPDCVADILESLKPLL